jgi:hypothetical protein
MYTLTNITMFEEEKKVDVSPALISCGNAKNYASYPIHRLKMFREMEREREREKEKKKLKDNKKNFHAIMKLMVSSIVECIHHRYFVL